MRPAPRLDRVESCGAPDAPRASEEAALDRRHDGGEHLSVDVVEEVDEKEESEGGPRSVGAHAVARMRAEIEFDSMLELYGGSIEGRGGETTKARGDETPATFLA